MWNIVEHVATSRCVIPKSVDTFPLLQLTLSHMSKTRQKYKRVYKVPELLTDSDYPERIASTAAHGTINGEGLLKEYRLKVYNALFEHGPLTANELFPFLGFEQQNTRHSVSSRLLELKKMGVVTEIGHRKCKITKVTVLVFDVTDKLPTEYVEISATKRKITLAKEAERQAARAYFNNRTPNHEADYRNCCKYTDNLVKIYESYSGYSMGASLPLNPES